MPRLTRLTNGFSRRLAFLRAAMAWHFAVYNFARVTAALRVTPAMALGVTDHVWSMEELVVASLDALAAAPPDAAPPPPPTPALTPGVRVRAERKSAARRVGKATAIAVGPSTPTAPGEGPPVDATVMRGPAARRDAAPVATAEAFEHEAPSPQLLLPVVNDDRVPRVLTRPMDAATDLTWMW